MKLYFHQTPRLLSALFPRRIWAMPEVDQQIYLTFDDGPVPGVTDFVLNELEKRGQQATFFVVGDNARRNPRLAKEILEANHTLGNHTFNHLNGWKTPTDSYLENVVHCQKILEDELDFSPRFFRPPYGLLKSSQAEMLQKNFQIVMWTLLSGDFDGSLPQEKVLEKTKDGINAGSVVVFHDQEKTRKVIRGILPQFLDFVRDLGWKTSCL